MFSSEGLRSLAAPPLLLLIRVISPSHHQSLQKTKQRRTFHPENHAGPRLNPTKTKRQSVTEAWKCLECGGPRWFFLQVKTRPPLSRLSFEANTVRAKARGSQIHVYIPLLDPRWGRRLQTGDTGETTCAFTFTKIRNTSWLWPLPASPGRGKDERSRAALGKVLVSPVSSLLFSPRIVAYIEETDKR